MVWKVVNHPEMLSKLVLMVKKAIFTNILKSMVYRKLFEILKFLKQPIKLALTGLFLTQITSNNIINYK